jgi:hypothetical protein
VHTTEQTGYVLRETSVNGLVGSITCAGLLDCAARPPLVASRTRGELVAPVRSGTAGLLHFVRHRGAARLGVEPRTSALAPLSHSRYNSSADIEWQRSVDASSEDNLDTESVGGMNKPEIALDLN